MDIRKLTKAMQEVWKAPADFNRAARREAGLTSKFWSWDAQALGIDPERPARYVRRHFKEGILNAPKTRRQRKQRARIIRSVKRRGMV